MPPRFEIRSELSAQRVDAPQNPMLAPAIVAAFQLLPTAKRAADQGCGKLRHLVPLVDAYRELVLVDTNRQLSEVHQLGAFSGSIREYIKSLAATRRRGVSLLGAEGFASSHLGLDVVFTVATYDVVPAYTRVEMARAAWRNLSDQGLYVVIIPRNDSSILRRCTTERAYEDGFAFRRNNVATFYRNFRDHRPVIAAVRRLGFRCERDLSRFRQVCLIFRKVDATIGHGTPRGWRAAQMA